MRFFDEFENSWEDSECSVTPIRLLTLAEATRGRFDEEEEEEEEEEDEDDPCV